MKPAPAFFIGVQQGFAHLPDIELFNLTEQVGIHTAGSTVSRNTLEKHGYTVPAVTERQLRREAHAS
jgi:hypothetical protein